MALVGESGGTPIEPVQHDEETLDSDQAERVEDWVKELVIQRKRGEQSKSAPFRRGTATASEAPREATM
jgi:hypothetical protein